MEGTTDTITSSHSSFRSHRRATMATTASIISGNMPSAPSCNKHSSPSMISSSEVVRSESVTNEEEEEEDSEVSLQLDEEDHFAILRAADPHVTEKFHASVGNRSKSPATRKIHSSVEVVARFSKSQSQSSQEDDKEEKREIQQSTEDSSFDSPIFAKPSFQPATNNEENNLLSLKYKNNETSFYGSKQDVFAYSPGSTNSDSSSCTSLKEDIVFCSPQSGPKPKQKNFVKNVTPGSAATKRTGPATSTKPRLAAVQPIRKTKPTSPTKNEDSSPKRAKSVSPVRARVSPTAAPKTAQQAKSRSSSLKRGEQEVTPMDKKMLKEKLLRLMDLNQQRLCETQSVSTKLTSTEVDDLVGNVSQHKRTPATTGGKVKMKIKANLLKTKLEQDKSVTLPISGSRCGGTTVTTSTSSSSKVKSPTKQKRIIKIRKSDLDGSDEHNKLILDDLLDKAASDWKATLKRSSMDSGTKWHTSSSPTQSQVSTTAPSATVKTIKKRPTSRSRHEKRTVAEEKNNVDTNREIRVHPARKAVETNHDVKTASNEGEQARDSSRSHRRSPKSYEILGSDDSNASKDDVTEDRSTRNRSKSGQTSTQPTPERRKSLFGDLKSLATPICKREKSSRSICTSDTRRPSSMVSIAKKCDSERRERSVSTPRAKSPEKGKTVSLSRRSLSNPRSQRVARTLDSDDDLKRGSTTGPFSLQGLQKMLGFSPPSNKEKVALKMGKETVTDPQSASTTFPDAMESPRSDLSSVKSAMLARIRQAGVTDAILLALSEQGLVIVERKARIPQ